MAASSPAQSRVEYNAATHCRLRRALSTTLRPVVEGQRDPRDYRHRSEISGRTVIRFLGAVVQTCPAWKWLTLRR
jgi:hypothetical protein